MEKEVISMLGKLMEEMTEMRTEFSDLRTEIRTEISDLRTEMKTEISSLRTEMNDRFDKVDEQFIGVGQQFEHMTGTFNEKNIQLQRELNHVKFRVNSLEKALSDHLNPIQ